MTVQLLSNEGNEPGMKIKWRKGSCSNVNDLYSSNRMDPMKALGGCDNVWANIVSYCAADDEDPDGNLIQDAVHIHTILSLVSKSWMSTFKEPSYIGHINVNLNALKPDRVIPLIEWMCRHSSHLSSFEFWVRYDHIPIIEKLLQETNTNNLRNISMRYEEYGTPWIDDTYSLMIGMNLNDTDPGLSLEEKATALDMPFASDVRNTELGMRLQESIALHCPNLESLEWNRGNAHRRESLDTPLLALPSLKFLELTIVFYHDSQDHRRHNDDLYLITKMIQNLRNLQTLELAFVYRNGRTDKKLHIHSKSLRHLDVKSLNKYCFVACKCPLLEKFVCDGGGNFVYGPNGSMPILSQDEIEDYNTKHKDETLVQCQSEMQLPDMEIPNECECTLMYFRPSLEFQQRFIESGTPIA